jgi:hypothetical protein
VRERRHERCAPTVLALERLLRRLQLADALLDQGSDEGRHGHHDNGRPHEPGSCLGGDEAARVRRDSQRKCHRESPAGVVQAEPAEDEDEEGSDTGGEPVEHPPGQAQQAQHREGQRQRRASSPGPPREGEGESGCDEVAGGDPRDGSEPERTSQGRGQGEDAGHQEDQPGLARRCRFCGRARGTRRHELPPPCRSRPTLAPRLAARAGISRTKWS